MNKCVVFLLTVIAIQATLSQASAAPVVLGLANEHPLTDAQSGELLMGELRCLACHTRNNAPALLERAAPILNDVGARVSPEYLKQFISSPSMTHAGSTMPDMFAGETAERRAMLAEAITHYLVAQSPRRFQAAKIEAASASIGKELFHSIGCVACHSPRDDVGKELKSEGNIVLAHIPKKYSLASLSGFLYQPLVVRPSGRMPDMKLNPAEAKALSSYLLGKPVVDAKPFEPDEKLVAEGKKAFVQYNCASCHKLGDIPAASPIIDLRQANPTKGCLTATPGKSPRFHLSDTQTKAIRAALIKKPEPIPDKTRLATSLVAFNCIACHKRDDYGGVSEERNPHFQTNEKNLGDEARVPPPLTLVGAKLQPVALQKMLFDGDSVRPYMYTRMPQYGMANLQHLPDLFAKLDSLKKVEFQLPNPERGTPKEREREKALRAGARVLLGDKALNCVTCHTFNGKSVSQKGIELMTVTQRLQPSWYYQYMLNPSQFRPRTVMPTSWPNGKAIMDDVLHGDTDEQLQAIWYYLSLGTSAADPSGVKAVESILSVEKTVRTYRGRSNLAGFRGIAVGFPEQVNYAFNAETGTLSALWRGGFVRVDRSGQGSGNFNPVVRPLALAQDVSFFRLPDEKTPWPLKPVMTKEEKTNPDPLYPKNRGYQFRGYELGDADVPTFLYRSGDIEIADHSSIKTMGKSVLLQREFRFQAPKAETIWFRALTGKIEVQSKTEFKLAELKLTIPEVPTLLRANTQPDSGKELLLRLDIPQGQSTRTFTYELLP